MYSKQKTESLNMQKSISKAKYKEFNNNLIEKWLMDVNRY